MGIHKSLVLKSRLRRPRSVLSRAERLEMLKEVGKWRDGDSVFGLPKVRTILAKAKKKKKEKAAVVEGVAGAPVAGGAAPAAAAGAAPAKGGAAPAKAGAAPAKGGAPAAAAAPGKKGDDKKK